MQKNFRLFAFVALLLVSKFSIANDTDNISCLNVSVFSEQTVDLDYNEGFVNCFKLTGVPDNSPVVILGNSSDKVRTRVRLYAYGTTQSHKFYDQYSDTSGVFVKETYTTSGEPIVRINPTSHTSQNKRLSISFTKSDDVYIIVYNIVATDWINWQGGNCNGVGCHYETVPGVEASTTAGFFLQNSEGSCSPDEEMPPAPANHDFNKHLRSVFRFGQQIEALSLNFISSDYVKHIYLVNTFRTGHANDLKSNSAYPGATPDYGNFWYGAVLASLGYSESYALYAGALYQEWEDNDWSEATTEELWEMLTNPQDNPDDPEFISKGHNYFHGAFQNDLNNNVSNSCTGESKSSSSSSSVSSGGGWSTSGGGVSFVGGSCIGNCGGHGNPNTTVTDLTEEEATGGTTTG